MWRNASERFEEIVNSFFIILSGYSLLRSSGSWQTLGRDPLSLILLLLLVLLWRWNDCLPSRREEIIYNACNGDSDDKGFQPAF